MHLPGGIELELDLGRGLIAANLGQRLLDRRLLDRRLFDWRLPLDNDDPLLGRGFIVTDLDRRLLDWRLPLENDLVPGPLLDDELNPDLLGLRSQIGLPFGSRRWTPGTSP